MTTYRVENLTPDRPRRVIRHGLTKQAAEADALRLNGYGHDGEYVIGENMDDPYAGRTPYIVSSESVFVFSRLGTYAGISQAWEAAHLTASDEAEETSLRRAAVNRGRLLRGIGIQGVPETSGVFGAVQTTAELADLTTEETSEAERAARLALITGQ